MKRSTDRILTTHAGSLPRPPDLLTMIQARESGEPVDEAAFASRVRSAVAEVVRKQAEAGIDVVSDGEMGKTGFANYVAQRLSGFGGENAEPRVFADRAAFPEFVAEQPSVGVKPRMCIEPLVWHGTEAIQTDLQNFRAALDASPTEDAFVPAPSLGIVADQLVNRYYPSDEAYLYALADALKEEYHAIADAGFVLQIDAPDAAMGRHVEFRNHTLDGFRQAIGQRVEILNHALEGIPEEQIRYHVCWGNYEGPHTHDVALKDIVDLVLAVRAAAYSVEASNPRHAHEWQVWEDVKLPEGKMLIPGVIDSATNFVEHPELVAQRIQQYAHLVGRENVMAGTDCGFGTSAGRQRVQPSVMWAKFEALAQGAEIASRRLWS
jgi:5-methyltetrahydropteroyltriglutamate--homocysteine methyltransferase